VTTAFDFRLRFISHPFQIAFVVRVLNNVFDWGTVPPVLCGHPGPEMVFMLMVIAIAAVAQIALITVFIGKFFVGKCVFRFKHIMY